MMPGIAGIMAGVSSDVAVPTGSYLFANGNYIDGDLTISSARTIVAWVKRTTGAGSTNAMTGAATGDLNTGDSNQARCVIHLRFSGSPLVEARSYIANSSFSAATGPTHSNGVWTHTAAVFASATSRKAYTNGVGGSVESTSRALPSNSHVTIGTQVTTARTFGMVGNIAHVAVWDIALSDAEIALLAAGDLPTAVQAGNLVFYAPLNDGTATDEISGNPLTVSGAVPDSDGPPL